MLTVSHAEYDRLMQEQSGQCAICLRASGSEGKSLAVDHDHKTGRVRGLLCTKCNQAIGFFGDNSELLKRAIEYLKKNVK